MQHREARPYPGHMAGLPERRKSSSTLEVLDTGLLVVVGVVVALLALKFVGFIAGAVFGLVKLALLAGAIFVVVRLVARRR
jgi:hypothetical protein